MPARSNDGRDASCIRAPTGHVMAGDCTSPAVAGTVPATVYINGSFGGLVTRFCFPSSSHTEDSTLTHPQQSAFFCLNSPPTPSSPLKSYIYHFTLPQP